MLGSAKAVAGLGQRLFLARAGSAVIVPKLFPTFGLGSITRSIRELNGRSVFDKPVRARSSGDSCGYFKQRTVRWLRHRLA
jgi:hypothetical protein